MTIPCGRGTARCRRSDAVTRSLLFSLALVFLSLVYSSSKNAQSFSLPRVVRQAEAEPEICDQKPGENNFLKSPAALSLYIPGILVMFVGLAVVTDEYFVPALERVCEQLNLSADVAGATFMAAGSSAPELFTSLLATFVTEDDIGVGTIVGSAVFNILVIIGLSAIAAGAVLELDWRPLIRDSMFYVMSIIFLMVFVLGSTRGQLDWWEGLIFMLGYVSYIAFMKWGNKPYMEFFREFSRKDLEAGEGGSKFGNLSSSQGDEESPISSDRTDVDFGVSSSNRVDLELGISSSDQASTSSPRTEEPMPQGPLVHNLSRRSHSTASQSKNIYQGINPRSRLRDKFRAAQRAVIAANRIASAVSESSPDSEMPNGHAEHFQGEDRDPEDKEEDDHEDSARPFWKVDIPTSWPGKILFPVTYVWKILFKVTIVDCTTEARKKWWPLTFAAAIVWIGGMSYAMVEAARYTGCLLSIPPAVMGLTVLAAGTSVPDALASMAVARNGEGDMAVSNAIGSNVFDILIGIGLPAFLGGLIKRESQHITVEPVAEIVIPIVILFAIVVLLIGAIALLKWRLKKVLGFVLFGTYGLFIIYSMLSTYVFFRESG